MSQGQDKIIQKLTEHDQQFEAINERFDKVDQRFEAVDQRFDKIDQRLDGISVKLFEHDQRLDQMVTKDEFYVFRDQVLTGQDEMIAILRRLDQEHVFVIERIKRIEEDVEEHRRKLAK
ncbi:MAG: hypothetical protein KGZ93_04690 [Actinobacteria bacterium]|nr:hypothetical protein [Actinomycetota bacterium]